MTFNTFSYYPGGSSFFGKPAAGASIFGGTHPTTSTSVFGTPQTAASPTASSPLFGSGSIFAAAAATSSSTAGSTGASDSVFGGSKPVFGQTPTATG